jgi:hypothetical protein
MSWPEAFATVGGIIGFALFIGFLAGAIEIRIGGSRDD